MTPREWAAAGGALVAGAGLVIVLGVALGMC